MRKSILLIIALVFLNSCADYTALVGPSYKMAKTGSILQAGTSYSASYGIKKITGQTPIKSLVDSFTKVADNEQTMRECLTSHSSSLTEVFFDTLDEIDCLKDPFSILK